MATPNGQDLSIASPYVRELGPGSGLQVYMVTGDEVGVMYARDAEKIHCIPLSCVLKPFMLLEPEKDAVVPLWTLIDFKGKRFGLTNIAKATVEPDMPE